MVWKSLVSGANISIKPSLSRAGVRRRAYRTGSAH